MTTVWPISNLVVLFLLSFLGITAGNKISYSKIKRDDSKVTYFDKQIPDPYGWISKLSGTDIHLQRQEHNKLAKSYCSALSSKDKEKIRKGITKYEHEAFLQYELPVIVAGTKLFLHELGEDKVFMSESSKMQWKVIVSLENIPETIRGIGKRIGSINPSSSGEILALCYTNGPSNEFVKESYHFMNTKTGKFLDDRIDNVTHMSKARSNMNVNADWLQWTANEKGIFYVTNVTNPGGQGQQTNRGDETTVYIFYHQMGTKQTSDVLVLSFKSKTTNHFIKLTSDEKYLILTEIQSEEIKGRPTYAFTTILQYVALCSPLPNCVTKKDAISRQTFLTSKCLTKFLGSKGSMFYIEVRETILSYEVVAVDVSKTPIKDLKDLDVIFAHDGMQNYVRFSGLLNSEYLVTITAINMNPDRFQIRKLGDMNTTTEIPLEMGEVSGLGIDSGNSKLLALTMKCPLTFQSLFLMDLSSSQLDKTKPNKISLPGYASASVRDTVTIQNKTYKTAGIEITGKPTEDLQILIMQPTNVKLDGSAPTLLIPLTTKIPNQNTQLAKYLSAFMDIFGGIIALPSVVSNNRTAVSPAGIGIPSGEVIHNLKSSVDWLITNKYTRSDRLTLFSTTQTSPLASGVIVEYPGLLGCVIFANVLSNTCLDLSTYFKTKDKMEVFLPLSPVHSIHNIKKGPAILLDCERNNSAATIGMKFIAELQYQFARDGSQTKPALARFLASNVNSEISFEEVALEQDTDMFAFISLSLGIPLKN